MKKQLAINTSYQLLARFVSASTSFFITIFISRHLGVFNFGELIKIISFVSVFYMPIDFGLNAVILRLISQHPNRLNYYLNQSLLIRIFLTCFAVFTCNVLVSILPGSTFQGFSPLVKSGVYIFSFTILIQALIKTTAVVIQYHLHYHYVLLAEFIQSATIIILMIFTLKYLNLFSILFGYLIGGSLAFLSQYFLMSKHYSLKLSLSTTHINKILIITALPIGLTIIVNTLSTQSDIMILTLFRTTEEVGVYGLVKRIMEIFFIIPFFFSNSLYPFLLAGKHNHLFKKLLIFMAVLGFLMTVILYLSSPLIIFIKPDYQSAIPLLKFFSFCLPLFFVTSPLMWYSIAHHQEKQLLNLYLTAFVVRLSCIYLLTPHYGAYASILGYFFSETCVLILLLKLYRHTQHITHESTSSKSFY